MYIYYFRNDSKILKGSQGLVVEDTSTIGLIGVLTGEKTPKSHPNALNSFLIREFIPVRDDDSDCTTLGPDRAISLLKSAGLIIENLGFNKGQSMYSLNVICIDGEPLRVAIEQESAPSVI